MEWLLHHPMVCFWPIGPDQNNLNLTNNSSRPFFTVCFIVSYESPEYCLDEQLKISNLYLATASDSPCYAQVQGKYACINHLLTLSLTYYIGGPMSHMPLHPRPTVSIAQIYSNDSYTNSDYISDRPDITPDTRPPPGMQYGIQPPPQVQGGWQQQPPLQPPPQAQGGLGYK